jgi:hypothetical protein
MKDEGPRTTLEAAMASWHGGSPFVSPKTVSDSQRYGFVKDSVEKYS